MIRSLLIALLMFVPGPLLASVVTNTSPVEIVLVVGAPGEKDFELEFASTAANWVKAAQETNRPWRLIDNSAGTNQLAQLREVILHQASTPSEGELWLVLVGHGTFDGRTAKFNLLGPDLSDTELSTLLQGIKRKLIVINTTASSAPFIKTLASPDRIVITATRSGYEENYARFGKYLASGIADPSADLDKDGQTSLLEAFLMASRQVEEFYKVEKRLSTEHALIDDNSDGLGTPATFFHGVRATKKPREDAELDGLRAHQVHFRPNADAEIPAEDLARRNELEAKLESLRAKRDTFTEDEYLRELEKILLQLSEIYLPAEDSVGAENPE